MTHDQPRKQRLAQFIREVWDKGNADAADAYLAPAYTIHHDPGDAWEGQTLDPAGFKHRLLRSRAAFPDQRFDIQHFVADGDAVVITWLWQATHQGDIPGYAATGKILRMSGATTYFFDEQDRLTGHWQITDRLSIFQQLERNKAAGN